MSAVKELKSLLDKNGRNYLYEEPYLVYKKLIASKTVDKTLAGAILMVLVCGCCRKLDEISEVSVLSKRIQTKCCFNKKMADQLAEVFIQLYSEENRAEWKKNDLAGWKKFRSSEFCFYWKGHTVWEVSNGGMSCFYNAEIVLIPKTDIVADKKLAMILEKNSFLTSETITEHYREELKKYLDYEFEDFIKEDDYYEPVVEDFEIEYCIKEWCKKYGFEFKSCKEECYDEGYESTFWGGRR